MAKNKSESQKRFQLLFAFDGSEERFIEGFLDRWGKNCVVYFIF